jgi:predicted Zn-dependent protease
MKTQIIIRALGALVLCTAAQLRAQEMAPLDRAAALAEARAGKWERAEPALEALAATVPTDPEVCAQLGLRRLDQKRHKEAVALAERAAEAAPNNAGLQSLYGRALGARIGELAFIQQGFVAPKMLRAFKRSVELDPNHVPGLIGLANYYLYSPAIAGGSYEKAEEYALQVEKLDAYNGGVIRAQIRERQDKWADAAVCYRSALAAQPKNAWLHTQLGNAHAKAGDKPAAKYAFESALQLQPDLAQAKEGLAALAAKTEN